MLLCLAIVGSTAGVIGNASSRRAAELHAAGDRDDRAGKLLIWAIATSGGGDVAVDVNAREKSS